MVNDSPSTRRGIFKSIALLFQNPFRRIDVADINVRDLVIRISILAKCFIIDGCQIFQTARFPMRRDLTEPFDAGVLGLGIGLESRAGHSWSSETSIQTGLSGKSA